MSYSCKIFIFFLLISSSLSNAVYLLKELQETLRRNKSLVFMYAIACKLKPHLQVIFSCTLLSLLCEIKENIPQNKITTHLLFPFLVMCVQFLCGNVISAVFSFLFLFHRGSTQIFWLKQRLLYLLSMLMGMMLFVRLVLL